MVARYRRMIAGLIMGSVSLFLSFHLQSLFAVDSGVVMRALKAAGFALVVPGLIAAILVGDVHAIRLSVMATVNFLFWFGFGWLLATFIAKLIELRRAIAATGVHGTGSPADDSLSVGRSDRSSSLGSQSGVPGDRSSSLGSQ